MLLILRFFKTVLRLFRTSYFFKTKFKMAYSNLRLNQHVLKRLKIFIKSLKYILIGLNQS